jgi:FkbM family methyltransferase
MTSEPVQIEYNGMTAEMRALSDEDIMHGHWISQQTFYEIELLKKIRELDLVGDYIDVGANLGNHSVFFAQHCPSTYLRCIEMHPEICHVLKKNLRLNAHHLVGYTVHETAVLDREGITCMEGFSYHNPGQTSVSDQGDGPAVPTTSLDILLGDITDVAMIKIDVEGEELKVIEGAKDLIRRCRPVIAVEVTKNPLEFNELMTLLGYTTDYVNYAHTPTFLYLSEY